MAFIYPTLGTAIAIAGADKLAGNRSYEGMFRHLGWTRHEMHAAALAEIAGGLMMAARPTRRLGGAVAAIGSALVLASEIRHGDKELAAPRALVLLAALAAAIVPGSR